MLEMKDLPDGVITESGQHYLLEVSAYRLKCRAKYGWTGLSLIV